MAVIRTQIPRETPPVFLFYRENQLAFQTVHAASRPGIPRMSSPVVTLFRRDADLVNLISLDSCTAKSLEEQTSDSHSAYIRRGVYRVNCSGALASVADSRVFSGPIERTLTCLIFDDLHELPDPAPEVQQQLIAHAG